MTDIQAIKQQYDLRDIVEQDLGQSHARSRRAHLYPCPFHNEQKGYSLAVWADGYTCFGKCDTSGDLFSWLMSYRNLNFTDALSSLGQSYISNKQYRPIRKEKRITPPSQAWQTKAKQVIQLAVDTLWSDVGYPARSYLQQRGLTDKTIQKAQLGYIPGHHQQWKRLFGLSIPCGILIPWIHHDVIWALKVRRAKGHPKYVMVKDSKPHCLYGLVDRNDHKQAVLCEGEFDTMILHQEAGDLVDVFTLGSASKRLNELNQISLLPYHKIWLAYDNDEAGQNRVNELLKLSHRMQSLQIPGRSDISDYFINGGNLNHWLNDLRK